MFVTDEYPFGFFSSGDLILFRQEDLRFDIDLWICGCNKWMVQIYWDCVIDFIMFFQLSRWRRRRRRRKIKAAFLG